jgi:hypothetical protein
MTVWGGWLSMTLIEAEYPNISKNTVVITELEHKQLNITEFGVYFVS